MGSMLDRFTLCELCKKPISDNTLCYECNLTKKKAQEFAVQTDATTRDVSAEFNIPQKLLEKWVKDGEFWCKAPCRSCGDMIKGGNLCVNCRFKFASELK